MVQACRPGKVLLVTTPRSTGAINRRQLVRYLTVLSGFVSRSRLEWGSGAVDRSSLIAEATEFEPRSVGR